MLPAHTLSSHLSSAALLGVIGCVGCVGLVGCGTGEKVGAVGIETGGATGSGGGAATGSGGSTAIGSGGSTGTGSGGVTGTGSGGAAPATGGRMAPPPAFALPWMDDFEANPVGPSAAGWLKHPKDTTGQWALVMDGTTKVLQQQNAAAALAMMVGGDVGWTNYKVEAKVKIATASSDVLAILSAHYFDPQNYYFLHLKGDGSIKIRKRIDDSTTDVLTFKTGTALVAGTWYTVAFSFQGSVVTAYLNGAQVATMTESPASLLSGGIGVGAQDGAVSWDDVKVTAQ